MNYQVGSHARYFLRCMMCMWGDNNIIATSEAYKCTSRLFYRGLFFTFFNVLQNHKEVRDGKSIQYVEIFGRGHKWLYIIWYSFGTLIPLLYPFSIWFIYDPTSHYCSSVIIQKPKSNHIYRYVGVNGFTSQPLGSQLWSRER